MSHYFTDNQNVPHDRKEFSFRFLGIDVKLLTDSGVFSKDHLDPGSELLIQYLYRQSLTGRFGDVGCGYGPIGIILKKLVPSLEVVMFDVNSRAVQLAKENAKLNEADVSVIVSNGFEAVEGQFDVIALNPPIRAGKEVIYSLFEQAHQRLVDGGKFLIVIRKQHGAQSAATKLREIFGNCERLGRNQGYHVYMSIKA